MRPPRSPVALAALVALLAVPAGCSSTVDDEPAPAVERHRAPCVVADPEGELIVHPGTLAPDTAVRVEGATLLDAVNLEVVEQAAVRFGGRPDVQGVITDYPPLTKAGIADSLAVWDERRPLAGLSLDAADGQQAVLVALRLADPTRPGHLDGVELTSASAGGQETTTWLQPLLVEPPGTLCTVAGADGTLEWVP